MQSVNLPATAICPGCATMVVLPAVPHGPEEPLICGTCGVEVPDHRHELEAAAAEAESRAEIEALPENRVYTRGSLLKGLRDAAAERALSAVRDIGERTRF